MGFRDLATAGAVIAVLLFDGCKPSRSPREMSQDDVTGQWEAKTRGERGRPAPDTATWQLELEQHAGGRISGRGRSDLRGAGEEFDLSGRRDSHRMVLEFRMNGGGAAIVAAVENPDRITGEIELDRDTIPVTLKRRR